MTVRRERRRLKKDKLRGNRSHGKGDTKHKRGKGSKGGKGRAGSFGHKFSKYYKELKSGHWIILNARKKEPTANLEEIINKLPRWLAEGKVAKQGNAWVVDGLVLGILIILSRGAVTEKLIIKNVSLSEKAKEKILQAQGAIEGTEEEAKGTEAADETTQ